MQVRDVALTSRPEPSLPKVAQTRGAIITQRPLHEICDISGVRGGRAHLVTICFFTVWSISSEPPAPRSQGPTTTCNSGNVITYMKNLLSAHAFQLITHPTMSPLSRRTQRTENERLHDGTLILLVAPSELDWHMLPRYCFNQHLHQEVS